MKTYYILIILLISNILAGTDLYVKYSGKSNNFNTIQEAVNKAASINPTSESQRVTIHIYPGKYREQVIVQTPYITFINDQNSLGEVTITWYYGIGYKYYSANSKGYYDANLARKKSSKNIASKWGATVQLWPKATYFKAKYIVFENSFNRYMTSDEVKDGVELSGDKSASSITVVRNSNTDINSKAATERAAAMTAEAAYAEFYGCKFLSSQDTLYTGGSPQYYRKCKIEGQTDYIFGQSNAVFDVCELRWKGYSGTSYPGYITAARSPGSSYTGYLFNKCKVTGSDKLAVKPGYLGRPWANTARVMFISTTLNDANMITPEGWYEMSGVKPETVSGFKEYGTILKNGQTVDLSKRKGIKLSASDASTVNKKNYMNKWTPTYYNLSE